MAYLEQKSYSSLESNKERVRTCKGVAHACTARLVRELHNIRERVET